MKIFRKATAILMILVLALCTLTGCKEDVPNTVTSPVNAPLNVVA